MTNNNLVLLMLVGVLAFASCQRADNPAGQSPADQVPESQIVLTEAFRIGDESTGDTTLFSGIISIATDSKGRLYVSDYGWIGIRVYSAAGEFEHVVGREGHGPSEFSVAPEVYISPEDTLYAWDWRADRVSIFSPDDHDFVTSFIVEGEDDRYWPNAVSGATSEGLLMEFGTAFSFGDPEGDIAERYSEVCLIDWSGAVVETVARLPIAKDGFIVHRTTGVILVRNVPFVHEPHFAYGTGQVLYYGTGDAINLMGVMPGTAPQQVASVSFDPVPVLAAERDSILSNASDRFRQGLAEQLPETKPAFNQLLADDQGQLWLALSREADAQETTWWIIDTSSGALAAELQLPQSVELSAIRHNRVFGAMEDEGTGAPFVVVWTIDESAE